MAESVTYQGSRSLTLAQIAQITSGEISQGTPETAYTGYGTLMEAGPQHVSFLGNDLYLPKLKTTTAGVLLVKKSHLSHAKQETALVAVANPSLAFDKVLEAFGPEKAPFVASVHPSAVIADGVEIAGVRIGARATIGSGAKIGAGSQIGAGCHIGQNVTLGSDCDLKPGSVVLDGCVIGNRVILHSGVVIGSDGFGYEFHQGRHEKIAQMGIVQIEDDVEIGANTTVDRARFGRTWIQQGTKIDNLVQIGHNAEIGKHCIIVALTGIAGSSKLGDYCVVAGQCGVAGHLEIAAQTTLAARTGVTKSISESGVYMGYPAVPMREAKEQLVMLRRLPEMLEQIRSLEKRLLALESAQT